METINGFEIEQYNIHNFKSDVKYDICPKCSHTRKKKTDKCVSLNWELGFWNCHHCGDGGQLHTFKKNNKEKVYEVPKFTYNKVDEKVKKWFAGRGISEQTLSHVKVTQSKEWMPQTKKEENTICFNYFLGDELVNIKYRDESKNFKLFKGAEKLFYNLDSIRLSKECVIVEGEIDALSFIEAGYYTVVSVPNGFNLQGNINLSYLYNYLNYFDNKEKIYLCLDNDEAGRKGRDEFIRRLGSDKCFLVDLNDCKDANEHLLKKGKESLLESIQKAKEVPLEHVEVLSQYSNELDKFWLNGMPKGLQANMPEFDEIYSAEYGQYTIIVGVPQSGKSEFLDQILIKYILKSGDKICYVSIENEPFIFHYDKIIQKIFGRKPTPNDIGSYDLNVAKQYVHDKRYTLEEVLDKFREVYRRKGTRLFAIDPFNRVKLKNHIQNINDFTAEYHLQIDAFVKETNSHLFLVAHPIKSSYIEGSKKSYNMPSAYDVKGGGEHFDMTYNMIGVNRIYEQKIVHIKTLKVKFKHLGEQQRSVYYGYNTVNGRYEQLEYQPDIIDLQTVVDVKKLDYSNWLKKDEESDEQLEEEIEEQPSQINPNTEFDMN